MSRKSKALEFVEEVYAIHVTGRNVLVTQSMKDYAIEKVSKIERFSDRIIDVTVTMDVQKFEHHVDIVMKVDHIKIKSSSTSKDMYVSIDQAVDKIETQLIKYKSKLHNHQARGVKMIDMNVNVIEPHRDDDLKDFNSEIEEANQNGFLDRFKPHKIIGTEKRALKYLSMDEAIMKLELSEDIFLVFMSEEDRKIKVIYRRDDGNFGIIEPQA